MRLNFFTLIAISSFVKLSGIELRLAFSHQEFEHNGSPLGNLAHMPIYNFFFFLNCKWKDGAREDMEGRNENEVEVWLFSRMEMEQMMSPTLLHIFSITTHLSEL